jgi:hypothetical protein
MRLDLANLEIATKWFNSAISGEMIEHRPDYTKQSITLSRVDIFQVRNIATVLNLYCDLRGIDARIYAKGSELSIYYGN